MNELIPQTNDTKLPYKLGSPGDPHFNDLSRTEATAKWYDETFFGQKHEELMDELINERGDKLMEEQE